MLKIATAPQYALIASGLDPAQTGKITAALDSQGIAYELRNNGTALAVQKSADGAGQRRARGAGRPGVGQRLAAGLRAARPEQARRLAVPAAGHLPACAGGRDRQVAARGPGRQEPDRAARDAAGRPLPGPGDAGHGRRHPRQLGRHAAAGRRARHGLARQLLGQGPEVRERHDHRLAPARSCGPRRRRGRRRVRRHDRRRRPRRATTSQLESQINAMLAATLGPGKAQVKVNADLNVDDTTQEAADLRQEGRRRSRSPSYDREDEGRRRDLGRHGRHRLERPDLLQRRRRRLGRRATTPTRRSTRPSASTRRSPRPRSPPARSTSSTSRWWSTSRSRRPSFTSLKQTVATAAGVRRRAVTRSPPPRWPSPRRPRRRRAPCRRRCSARSSGSASASPA